MACCSGGAAKVPRGAAAMSVKAGVGPKELDAAALVAALKADGVYLP